MNRDKVVSWGESQAAEETRQDVTFDSQRTGSWNVTISNNNLGV